MNDKTIKQEIAIAINTILSKNKGKKYASLQEIYKTVAEQKGIQQNKALEAQIRGRLQEHCSQYKNYLGNEDLFETKKINSGLWRNKISGEKDLKKHVFEIIRKFPGIDITNLQKSLLDLIIDDLTKADKLESLTRPGEMKIEQIIRNFVSHRERYKNEIEFVTSSDGTTRLYLKEELLEKISENNEERKEKNPNLKEDESIDETPTIEIVNDFEREVPNLPINEEKLSIDKNIPKVKKKNNNQEKTYTRKSDFDSYIRDYKKKLDNGYIAEGLVYDYEKERLINLGRLDLAKKVIWMSRDCGDGFGYDIKSYEITDGIEKEIFIEVKSTSSSLSTDFEMSNNEYEFAKAHIKENNYKLYRISRKNGKNTGYIIDSPFDENFNIVPSTYKISIKTRE